MKIDKEHIKSILEKNENLKDKIFNRGFIFADNDFDVKQYPFYGKWIKTEIFSGKDNSAKYLYVSPNQKFYTIKNEGSCLILVGHAYNPFTAESDENEILKILSIKQGKEFLDYFNQLSGIFTLIVVESSTIYVFGDPAGMQTTYYGHVGEHFAVATHANLVGDLFDLKVSDYVKSLASYKFFKLLGNSLPGDLSPFEEIKRLIPNHLAKIYNGKIEVKRYFLPTNRNLTVDEIVEKASDILKNNLKLIAKKWNFPAISMTGGCDSKTTLSCACEIYDKFNYFSYVSSEEERVDAIAAKTIIENLGLEHKIYEIPNENSDFDNFEQVSSILFWNMGALRKNNQNDVRKRIYFSSVNDFDVEVKSWASEIGRAYYTKRFNGRKKFGNITPRKLTTLYKFFFHNRKLVKQTDKVFENYQKSYLSCLDKTDIPWQELFFWEFRMSSWNGNVITGEHKYSFDITIPYNNKHLLELLLSADISERESDGVYKKIRNKNDLRIDQNGVNVTNVKHTKNRAKIEDLYYVLHSKFPF